MKKLRSYLAAASARLGLPMDITDEEVENELKNMPEAIDSGFNLGAYC